MFTLLTSYTAEIAHNAFNAAWFIRSSKKEHKMGFVSFIVLWCNSDGTDERTEGWVKSLRTVTPTPVVLRMEKIYLYLHTSPSNKEKSG